jgi:hypothetical protein
MSIASTLDRVHRNARNNRWLWLFSIFCRLALAAGFIPAAIVKLIDERFASGLAVTHPMGAFLEALHHTGYYYTFIGVVQAIAAVFLLVPRTVTLGAFLYLPVIVNITVLTYAVRFDGSLFTAPLMTLANLYILGWNYEKWKFILPFRGTPAEQDFPTTLRAYLGDSNAKGDHPGMGRPGKLYGWARSFLKALFRDRFPALFFAGVLAAIVICVVGIPSLYSVKPRNTMPQCLRQFERTERKQAGKNFCTCIHENGHPLGRCLDEYNNAPGDIVRTQ